MSKLKLKNSKKISVINYTKGNSIANRLYHMSIKAQINAGIKDVEEGKTITLLQLKEAVSNWKL